MTQPKADAARSEKSKNPKPKTYTWRGLKLTLPDTLPGEILFDLAAAESGGSEGLAVFTVLEAIVGPEQYQKIRAKVVTDKLGVEDTTGELRTLFSGILKKFGLGPGESEASQG